MKWFYNLKVSAKLLTGFMLVAMIAAIIGAVGIVNIKNLDNIYSDLIDRATLPLGQMIGLSTDFQLQRVNLRDMAVDKDYAMRVKYLNNIKELDKAIDEKTAFIEKTMITEEGKKALADLKQARAEFYPLREQILRDLVENREQDAIALLRGDGAAKTKAVDAAISRLSELKTKYADQVSDENTAIANRTVVIMAVFVVAGVLLAMGIGVFVARTISTPLKKALHMIEEMSKGHLNARLHLDSKDEVGQMAMALDAFVGDLQQNVVGVMRKIGEGDINTHVADKDAQDEISPAIRKTVETIRGLLEDTALLIQATQKGKLDTRGDALKYNGAWKELMIGINNLIDSFVSPFHVTAEYVERISNGNIPPKITDVYYGDFNEIKNNLNNCIDIMNGLLKESDKLIQATKEGKLDVRGDDKKFAGDWGGLVHGINEMMDAFVAPIHVTAAYVNNIGRGEIPPKITEMYYGDFNEIKNNLNNCIDSITALVTDANLLAEAALAGNLSTRADAAKHSGDYRKIVEGVNKTLDAVIEPVREAADVLDEMSRGNLQRRVKGDYRGDHAQIKNALNETLESLSSYVGEIAGVLSEIARSNLDIGINNEYRGDFIQIKEALNLIIQSLNEVFFEINASADEVASGSRQVSDGSQALSQGTTEQASAVEQLTVSIGQVASQTKDNAVNANQANVLAAEARSNAETGNAHMREMLQSMVAINDSSANISKIIKVIDEIAFQTNILALNAAVEAARAGQHGKGFAVVAEEVRNLAARSANAAKETTMLIEGSIKKVEAGTSIANETAKALDEIVHGVTKAANLVGEIAAASNEQATAISQINKGVEQVSIVVQTNSATAEESAAASEELSAQAEHLKGMVGNFRLKKSLSRHARYADVQENEGVKAKGAIYPIYAEAAATSSKNKIALSDREFGKY